MSDMVERMRAIQAEWEAGERADVGGFWDRLGVGEDGLPVHMPMGVTEDGRGPENDVDAHHFECWCGQDPGCPLTLALTLASTCSTQPTPDEAR